jgi:AcrR family transcriptional regulator
MNTDQISTPKNLRGRPKTLNCKETVEIAMQEYWLDENNNISLNEICKRAKVSKPGIYREFGNEDGLIEAVLLKYEEDVTSNLLSILTKEETLKEKIEALAIYITTNENEINPAKGCLLVKMQNSKLNMGPKSQAQIHSMQKNLLMAYEKCIKKAKAKDQFKANISDELAAEYFNSQINNAALLIIQGHEKKKVKNILTLSLSVFI